MALAVCLLFDRRGDLVVRGLWARLEQEGVRTLLSHTHGHHLPHLSYAVLLDWSLEDVTTAVEALPDHGPFDLTFHGAVVFPRGRVALAPSLPSYAGARQEAVATTLAGSGATLHRHYAPGEWVPHVSVATRANGAGLPVALRTIADVVPVTVRAERAALVDSSTGDTWPLPGVP